MNITIDFRKVKPYAKELNYKNYLDISKTSLIFKKIKSDHAQGRFIKLGIDLFWDIF